MSSLVSISLSHSLFGSIDPAAFGGFVSLEGFSFPSLSRRLLSMSLVGRREVEQKISEAHGIVLNGEELATTEPPHFAVPEDMIGVGEAWVSPEEDWFADFWVPPEVKGWFTARRKSLSEICELIHYNELIDATTIIDLALWKMGIAEAESEGEDAADRVVREARRVELPRPARETIVAYARGLKADEPSPNECDDSIGVDSDSLDIMSLMSNSLDIMSLMSNPDDF